MFADPQSITINAVAQSLPTVSRGDLASTYRKDDGSYNFVISRVMRPLRVRHSVRLNAEKIAADLLTPTTNSVYSASTYLVIDRPVAGYTNLEMRQIVLGLTGWLTQANIDKVLACET